MTRVLRYNLRNHPDFFAQARKIYHQNWTLFWLRSESESEYSVIVDKKTSPLATERHVYKRQLAAILREILKEKPGFIVVVKSKPGIRNLEFGILNNQLEQALFTLHD